MWIKDEVKEQAEEEEEGKRIRGGMREEEKKKLFIRPMSFKMADVHRLGASDKRLSVRA